MSDRKLTRKVRNNNLMNSNSNISLNVNNNRIRIIYNLNQILEISYQDGMIFADFDVFVRKRFRISDSSIIIYKNEDDEGNVIM